MSRIGRPRRGLLNGLAGAICLFASTSGAFAATFVVTTTVDSNNGACTALLCTLRDAIIAANANPGADIVTLPLGTYTLTIAGTGENAAATGDLDINDDLTINGAGSATTIIDGGGIDRVFDIRGGSATVNDVTIRNGLPASGENGGGIQNLNRATLNRVVVTANHTSNGGNGAGVYTADEMAITHSVINGNSAGAGGSGGGAYNSSTLTVTDSTITGNSAGPSGGNGGGLFNSDEATITSSLISGNTTAGGGKGGGVYDNGFMLTLTASTVSGNSTAGGGDGGGVYTNGNIAAATALTISGNSAAGGSGGGIWVGAIALNVTNSTISGNNASRGGGVYYNGLDVTILSTTIANNTGGGIETFGSTFTLTNTIVANNGVNCTALSPITDGGTNMQFPGMTCGAGITTADPLLQPLSDNGGPTLTHALGANSPGINAGTTGCPPTPAADQRGVDRPQGIACDIGAFEAPSGPTPPPPVAQQPIPTMNAWGLVALVMLLVSIAAWALRTRGG